MEGSKSLFINTTTGDMSTRHNLLVGSSATTIRGAYPTDNNWLHTPGRPTGTRRRTYRTQAYDGNYLNEFTMYTGRPHLPPSISPSDFASPSCAPPYPQPPLTWEGATALGASSLWTALPPSSSAPTPP